MTNSEQAGNPAPQAEPTVPLPPEEGRPPAQPPYPQQPYPPQSGQPYPAQPYPGQPYPGQPYPGQAYPGQPFPPAPPQPGEPYPAQGGYPGQPYDVQQPYRPEPPQPMAPWAAQAADSYPAAGYGQPPNPGYPPQPPAAQPAGRSRVPLILAGAVTGLILIAVVAAFVLNRGAGDPLTAPTPGPGGTVAPPTATAQDAVQGYLEALARGDAAGALAYAVTAPADPALLTDEVLATSLAAGPLQNIRVSPGTGGAADRDQLTAEYQLGSRSVSTTFTAVKTGGNWRLDRVTQVVSLTTLDPEVTPLLINGATLASAEPELFPGTYQITSDSTRYTVSRGTFNVDSPSDFNPGIGAMSLALSKAGVAEVRSAAQKKLRSCLKAKKLSPSGCGFGTRLPTGKPRTSTIEWKVTKGGNALKTMKPTLTPGDPTSASGNVTMTLVCTFDSTNGYSWRGVSGIYSVQALFSGDGVKVTFN